MSRIVLPATDLTKAKSVKVKKRRPRRTLEQKTAQQLISEADKWFSRYVRLRDSVWTGSQWVSSCICCGKPLIVMDDSGKWRLGTDNGHFISRGLFSLRFNEYNCNAQSSHCNAWKDKQTMLEGYRGGIRDKYGETTLAELIDLSKSPEAYKRPPKHELLEIIHDSKTYIDFALAHPENYLANNR